MFTVKAEWGIGAYALFEVCESFETVEMAHSFADQIVTEITEYIRIPGVADNAVIRIWRDDKAGNLINSCVREC